MDWRDEGIVLSTRSYGETGAILELFTRAHGRHLGLVRGGAGRRFKGALQSGNSLSAHWRARLEDHLGTYTVEVIKPRAGLIMEDGFALLGLSAACAVAGAIPEREAHEALYEGFELLLDLMDDNDIWPAIYVRWELGLLQELGFGLDLSECAATGARDELVYVSPRSGRAVSRVAGEPYKDRLFVLPDFMRGASAETAHAQEVAEGLKITGHFLERHIFGPHRGALPDARVRLQERFLARA